MGFLRDVVRDSRLRRGGEAQVREAPSLMEPPAPERLERIETPESSPLVGRDARPGEEFPRPSAQPAKLFDEPPRQATLAESARLPVEPAELPVEDFPAAVLDSGVAPTNEDEEAAHEELRLESPASEAEPRGPVAEPAGFELPAVEEVEGKALSGPLRGPPSEPQRLDAAAEAQHAMAAAAESLESVRGSATAAAALQGKPPVVSAPRPTEPLPPPEDELGETAPAASSGRSIYQRGLGAEGGSRLHEAALEQQREEVRDQPAAAPLPGRAAEPSLPPIPPSGLDLAARAPDPPAPVGETIESLPRFEPRTSASLPPGEKAEGRPIVSGQSLLAAFPGWASAGSPAREPEQSGPRVHIGQVDVIVQAPKELPRPRERKASSNLASRLYLRSV